MAKNCVKGNRELAKAIDKVAPMSEARAGVPKYATGTHAGNLVVQSGLQDMVCWYKFAGLSARATAKKLNLPEQSVQKYVKSEHFAQVYAKKRDEMLSKVAETAKSRVLEVYLEALELKVRMLQATEPRFRRIRLDLRNKIASELMAEAKEVLKGTSAGISDRIKAMYEQTVTEKTPTGEVKRSFRITGPASAAQDSALATDWPLDATPSGPSSALNAGSGAEDRKEGDQQDAPPVTGAGGNSGSGT